MQGIPTEEGYEPLPLNSTEDIYREEVENRSDAGSVATPLLENLERALVIFTLDQTNICSNECIKYRNQGCPETYRR